MEEEEKEEEEERKEIQVYSMKLQFPIPRRAKEHL